MRGSDVSGSMGLLQAYAVSLPDAESLSKHISVVAWLLWVLLGMSGCNSI